MTIEGDTGVYAVLGHPVAHSLSPAMHNAAFSATGLNGVYVPFDVQPESLMSVLESMASMGVRGVNLTVPLKEVAYEGLEQLDESARLVGAVNTVAYTPDGLVGHNTDGYGFLTALHEETGFDVAGKSVLIAGVGGAGRALAITLARAGVSTIRLANRSIDKALRVRDEILEQCSSVSVDVIEGGVPEWCAASLESDLVINGTSMGMHAGDVSILPAEAFREGQVACDLIYMTPETVFTKAAKDGGAIATNGLGMLLHQGARAFEIWTQHAAPVSVMREVLETRVYGTGGR